MSCPFASSSSSSSSGEAESRSGSGKRRKRAKLSSCPFTGKTSAGDDSQYGGCQISRSGGLDFSIQNQFDNGTDIPLTNIPRFLTIQNLKQILQASTAVKLPPGKSWEDVFFCRYDNLTPLKEDKPLEQLGIKCNDILDMGDTSSIKPVFIKAVISNGKSIGLNYVPPWSTVTQLKKIIAKRTPVSLDDCQCYVNSNNNVINTNNGVVSVDDDGCVPDATTGERVLKETVQLGSLGNLLEVTFKKS